MHEKVIVHIDIDCFYAQVEEIADFSLRDRPLGIQQKTCLVTCNYKAREFGLKKLMFIPEAQKLCKELVLVNGEDLTKYKKMSDQIFDVLQKFVPYVEKLGLDENYIDVTEIVQTRMNENSHKIETGTFTLNYDTEDEPECDCGCQKRLLVGTHIAQEIRHALFDQLGITSCAGISHNKLLAKLVGSQNKPNKQTVIFPHQVSQFLRALGSVRSLCGIGSKTAETLECLAIKTVNDLQNIEISVLKRKFDEKMAEHLKTLAFGTDKSEVKPTGKQKTISIEDSTYSNPLKTVLEVETKLKILLTRLVDAAIIEQKRTPTALRITIRKTTNIKELLQRESRQKDIPQSWSKMLDPVQIVPLLYPIAIQLFKQIMNSETQLKITLVGVALTKFLDQVQIKETNALLKFLKPLSNSPKIENEQNTMKRKEISKSEDDIKEPSPKKLKSLALSKEPVPAVTKFTEVKRPSSAQKHKTPLVNFEIPKDMDTKEFNRLKIPEKKQIMDELKNAKKMSIDTSLIDYPRKVEPKVEKNKMDAFVFKY